MEKRQDNLGTRPEIVLARVWAVRVPSIIYKVLLYWQISIDAPSSKLKPVGATRQLTPIFFLSFFSYLCFLRAKKLPCRILYPSILNSWALHAYYLTNWYLARIAIGATQRTRMLAGTTKATNLQEKIRALVAVHLSREEMKEIEDAVQQEEVLGTQEWKYLRVWQRADDWLGCPIKKMCYFPIGYKIRVEMIPPKLSLLRKVHLVLWSLNTSEIIEIHLDTL